MVKVFITAILLLFGIPPGTPQNVPGAVPGSIEGRVIRSSTSDPIAGVQIVLVPPAPAPNAPQPAVGQPAQTVSPAAAATQAPQIVRGADGSITVRNPNGGVIVIPAGVSIAPELMDRLTGVSTSNPLFNAVTDSDGKFAFRDLAPGLYTIRAQRQGYFGAMTPQGTYAGNVSKTIAVESGKTANGDVGMVQGGVLRGLVKDPDGDPAPNYAVVTARPGYVNGRYIWILTGAMNADDRGEYRWPNFAPGEYYVGVGPRAPGPIANVQDAWARVFYPGVIDPNQARPVTIPEGGEVTINLSAQLKPWGTYKISGVALNPLPNLPPDPVTGVVNRAASALILMPLSLTPLDNPPTTMWTNLVATNTKPNGEFELSNVDPGRYELYAMVLDTPDGPNNQTRRMWTGHMPVEVRDRDLTGLTITVSPGVTLQGEIVVTGAGAAAVRPETLRVQLQSLTTLPPQVAMAVGVVSVDEKGKFQIANLSEGRYRMSVQTPPGAYVAAMTQGGTNVFDDGFDLDKQNAQLPIHIEVDMAGESVEGNVRIGQDKDAASAIVVLVPATHRNNPALYKTATTDAKGHFVIRGVAPGVYNAFAWESVLPGAYQNEEFLTKNQSRGRVVNVQAGTRSEVLLDLIRSN